MYPSIVLTPRLEGGCKIDLRHTSDPNDWETWFDSHCLEDAAHWLNLAVSTHKDWPVCIEDNAMDTVDIPISGYVFNIRRDNETIARFFKSKNQVSNPFYNRKVYQEVNGKDATVNFQALNI